VGLQCKASRQFARAAPVPNQYWCVSAPWPSSHCTSHYANFSRRASRIQSRRRIHARLARRFLPSCANRAAQLGFVCGTRAPGDLRAAVHPA
jgi:hypothetical protein